MSGVIHAAADLSFSPDPNVVIPPTIHTTLAVLKAAARSPSVKRFVLTSSCAAATSPQVGRYPTVTSESWNDEAIQQAWADPPYTSDRGFAVYAASKTVAEKESWAWVAKTRPAFTLNTGEMTPLLRSYSIASKLILSPTSPTCRKLWKEPRCNPSGTSIYLGSN